MWIYWFIKIYIQSLSNLYVLTLKLWFTKKHIKAQQKQQHKSKKLFNGCFFFSYNFVFHAVEDLLHSKWVLRNHLLTIGDKLSFMFRTTKKKLNAEKIIYYLQYFFLFTARCATFSSYFISSYIYKLFFVKRSHEESKEKSKWVLCFHKTLTFYFKYHFELYADYICYLWGWEIY